MPKKMANDAARCRKTEQMMNQQMKKAMPGKMMTNMPAKKMMK